MTEIRRESRLKLISQKRSSPAEVLKHGNVDLQHLEEYENKDQLIPKLREFMDMDVSVDDLGYIEKVLKDDNANM